jgi:hypothetical protein
MKAYDIMYHVSQQLVDIIKSLFHNEVQLGKELKAKRSNSYDKYATFNIQVVQGNLGQIDVINQSHSIKS